MSVCPGSGRPPKWTRFEQGRLVTCPVCWQPVTASPNPAGVVRIEAHEQAWVAS